MTKANPAACTWVVQRMDPDCLQRECSATDPIRDFRRDPSGFYVLIRLEPPLLAVAVCTLDHEIIAVFRGATARDVYTAILRHQESAGAGWLTSLEHVAYLGRELGRAEAALASGQAFVQE